MTTLSTLKRCPQCQSADILKISENDLLNYQCGQCDATFTYSIRQTETNHGYASALPRCVHGHAFCDHSGEWLVMDCGCKFPRDWNENPQPAAKMRRALQGVLHHNDAVKAQYKLPESLIRQIRKALECA